MQAARKNPERSVDKWMSLYEAAAALGESRTKVLTRIARRELESDFIAKRTLVSRESVDRVLAAKSAEKPKK